MPSAETCSSAARERGCHLGDPFRGLDVEAVETLAAALVQDRDKIDRRVRALERRLHGILVLHIGLDDLDLADPAHRRQEQRVVGAAHRHADTPAFIGKRAHHVPAEKTRTAKDGDKPRGGNGGHDLA
jgi:phosphoglycerate dehydrogenase-like enzyme